MAVSIMDEMSVIENGNLGVKGFEILFQTKIEDALEKSGLTPIWWKYHKDEQIFLNIWSIYKQGEFDNSTWLKLQEYYDYLRRKTNEIILNELFMKKEATNNAKD